MTSTIGKRQTGIFYQTADEDYRNIDWAVSKSDLDAFVNPDKAIDEHTAMLGTVFHLIVLEPDKLNNHVAIGPDVDMRTNDGKAKWAEWAEQQTADYLLRPTEADMLRSMRKAVDDHPELSKVRKARVVEQCEVTAIERDPVSGVCCKGRIDQVTRKALLDWKTTGVLSSEEFDERIIAFNYHVQGALYRDIYEWVTGESRPFAFCCVSKRDPHPCWIRVLTDWEIAAGRAQYQALLRLYARFYPEAEPVLPF